MNDTTVAPWIKLPQPDKAMTVQADGLLAAAHGYIVDSPEMREAAASDVAGIRKIEVEVENKRKEITGPLDTAKRAVMSLFAPMSATLAEARQVLSAKVLRFDAEAEAKVREAQRIADQAAAAERARLEAAAKEAAATGNVETAAALESAATMVAAATVIVAPIASATTTRSTWESECFDMIALVKAAAIGDTLSLSLLQFDQTAGNALARSRKVVELGVPGVRGIEKKALSRARSA